MMGSKSAVDESLRLGNKKLKEIYQGIQQVYLTDHRPWVVGYSGGKDSTAVLQLIWYALSDLSPEERCKSVYVISSDTLVENPIIIEHINTALQKINNASIDSNMPFKALKVMPPVSESFWVNLIGRGYPAPSTSFRWCTDRLKIQPTNKFIKEQVARYGEVVVVLGVRKSESSARAQVMSLHKIKGSFLSRHTHFPQAFVYTPLEDFSVDDVWNYLLRIPSPWKHSNHDLLELYKSAHAEERPFVIDKNTPATGSGRFGCWTCTVVTKDKSMEALIENGNEWLKPLHEIREKLAKTQIPDDKHLYRDFKRRNGKTQFKRDGSGDLIRGPYTLEFLKELLRDLLEAQNKIRKGPYPSMNIILPEELHEIRRMWQLERGDWQDSLPKIYREVTGEDLDWIKDDLGAFTHKDEELLENICKIHDLPMRLVTKLLDVEREVQGMSRRSSVYSKIDNVFSEEWRPEDEIIDSNRQIHSTHRGSLK